MPNAMTVWTTEDGRRFDDYGEARDWEIRESRRVPLVTLASRTFPGTDVGASWVVAWMLSHWDTLAEMFLYPHRAAETVASVLDRLEQEAAARHEEALDQHREETPETEEAT